MQPMTLAPECSFKWDGAALGIFLGAIPLAIALTFATLIAYRWAVGRAMRAAASEAVPVPEPPTPSLPCRPLEIAIVSPEPAATGAPPSLTASLQAMRRLSAVYALAGIAHAVVATALLFWLNDLAFRPFRTLAVCTVFAWPVAAVLMMTADITRRQQVALATAYFAFLLLLEIIAEAFHLREHPAFGELFLLWGITMGPPTAVIALLANRAWRSVGLIALFVSIVLVAAFLLGFQLLGCMVLTTKSEVLLASMTYLRFAIVLGCGVLAWMLLRRAARRYQAKLTSDQMFALDSWWLLVTALEILFEMGSSSVAGFSFVLAFAAYKILLGAGLRRLHLANLPGKSRSLLLLRVFGHSQRVRTLADQIGQTWRHAGPLNMIGGTDLATALLEPDELMRFWSGKLRQGFVASSTDLDKRLQHLDEDPDPDGRCRINEFFCHDNTWRATVRALARRSAVVLMDLRGFGRQNRGCEAELAMLLGEVPLARVLLLVDRTTRTAELQELLRSMWNKLPSSSPNRDMTEPVLNLFQIEDAGEALRPLLSLVFAAAA